MDDPRQPEQRGSAADNAPAELSKCYDDSDAPQGQQISIDRAEHAKKFVSKYVGGPIGSIVVWTDAHSGLVTAISTVAIAILTYFVAVYANGQLGVFRSQLEEMRSTGTQTDALIEIYKKQAEAASVQAQAAKDTAIIAHENLVASQRAWIAPTSFSFIDLNDVQQPLRVRMTYQNVGREPARNVRNYIIFGYIRDPRPPEISAWAHNPTWFKIDAIKPATMCANTAGDVNSVVYPSSTVGFTLETASGDPMASATQILFEEVKSKKSIYYVAGCLSYETLKERKNSTFCAALIPVEGKEISQWQFGACPVGNDDF